jgi:hypothetical protein
VRLLLILCLIVASAGFGAPVGAQAPHHGTEDHAPMAHHDTMPHDSERGSGKASVVVHVCPGCAVVGPAIPATAEPAPRTLPALPADPPALISFDSNPIPPPPRFA